MTGTTFEVELRTGAAAVDVINTIALQPCADTRHVIRFLFRNELQSWSLAELDRKATCVAGHLHTLGIRPRDRIGIMAHNCIEWVLLDLAVLKLGAVTAGFEAGRFDAEQMVAAYGLKALFAEGLPTRGMFFGIELVARWCDASTAGEAIGPFHTGYDPSDICAIKFTSGSTGVPKGLEATVASVNSSLSAVQQMFAHGSDDNILVFLRLALLQQRYWIYSALVFGHNITLSDVDHALETAKASAPTVVMGVPGFYEGLRTRLQSEPQTANPAARGNAIQAALGGRIRYLWTGSAPAGRAVLDFFNDAGVPLYEGYGLNETCIVAKNHPGAFRPGSVGRVLPNKAVRFDKDGILIVGSRSPVNCRYTWCADGANEKTFLPTGEVKTYDLGRVDEDGFLYIHCRVDDVLALSSGRNVLVRLIEERLREHPDVHECVLFGNGKPFLTAIVSPHVPGIDIASLRRHVLSMNGSLLPEQHVHAVLVAPERFSIESGLLTSQFKPKRNDIYRHFAAELAGLYDDDAQSQSHEPGRAPQFVSVGALCPAPTEPPRSQKGAKA